MRTFRKCITEFALEPGRRTRRFSVAPLALSRAHRYRHRISRHHAGGIRPSFSREHPHGPCAPYDGELDANGELEPWTLYGFASAETGQMSWWTSLPACPNSSARTCLAIANSSNSGKPASSIWAMPGRREGRSRSASHAAWRNTLQFPRGGWSGHRTLQTGCLQSGFGGN